MFRKKRPDTGAHPVNDDLEMAVGKEFEEQQAVMECNQLEGTQRTERKLIELAPTHTERS